MFEVGEEIVCVDDRSVYGNVLPIKEGFHYFVKGYFECRCGEVCLDIGISSGCELICTRCYLRHKTNIWPFRQSRFVPLSHIENLNELYETSRERNWELDTAGVIHADLHDFNSGDLFLPGRDRFISELARY